MTIGQVPETTPTGACSTQRDTTQPTVTSGNAYTVPDTGGIVAWTVTSWSTFASGDPGQTFTMKLFRQVTGSTYRAVAHDVPRDLTPGVLNTFATNVVAMPGDILGLNSGQNPGDDSCNFLLPPGTNDSSWSRSGDLADGEAGDFGSSTPFFRVNASAVITPTSTFTIGKPTRNRRKGTARIAVSVPNPGGLSLSGKGVKPATMTIGPPATVSLAVRAKGKKRRKLNQTGKVKVPVSITYIPAGGDSRTQSAKVKLRKR
jgi:hypothetical protein